MNRPRIDRAAISLTALRYLVALAEHEHFGRAAAACHVSQPTLSEQIQKLETLLGARLVERGRRVRLTDAGRSVVERARRIQSEVDELVSDTASSHDPLVGRFRLGVIPTLAPYLLPSLLPALRAAHPRLQLVLHEVTTDGLLTELADHQVDAALLSLPIARPGLVSRELFDELLFVLVPMDHALASRGSIRVEDLRDERVLLLSEGHCLRDQALELCESAALDTHDVRATSLETLARLVAANLGVTIVPALALPRDPAVVARPLVGGRPATPRSRKIGLVRRKSHARHQDIEALARILCSLPRSADLGARPPRARRSV